MKWRGLEAAEPAVPTTTLFEELEQRRALAEKYVPVATQEVHRRSIAELQQSGLVDRILPVGAKAPTFELPDQDGKPVGSSTLLSRGRLLICFFRGRWCPFCLAQMEAMNHLFPAIRQAGASLVGIAPQTVKQCFFMHDQHQLKFPLLSDSGNQVARQFGLVYKVPEYQQNIYRSTFTNLPFINGEPSWELPIPATFILEPDGTAQFASADPDYTRRSEPADLLRKLTEAPQDSDT
jgi:peroxiredoxin